MIKKLIIFVVPLLLIATRLTRRIHLWYQAKKEINQLSNQIIKLEEENRSLIKKREYYQSEEFIHREAREKLGMTKENELILIIPTPPDLSILKPKGEKYDQLPPWRQWQRLFFD